MKYEDFQFLLFDRQPDGVLLVTLNRPEVMNATNNRMHWELTQVWGVVAEDPSVKVVVVTGPAIARSRRAAISPSSRKWRPARRPRCA